VLTATTTGSLFIDSFSWTPPSPLEEQLTPIDWTHAGQLDAGMLKSIGLQKKFETSHSLSQSFCQQLTISTVSGMTLLCSNYVIKHNLKVASKCNLYIRPSTKEETIR